jgi:predicted CopG family antitoxin
MTKTVALADDAYLLLASQKRPDESFSDVVRRMVPRRPLTDLIGCIPKASADAIAQAIEDNRRLRVERRRKELGL